MTTTKREFRSQGYKAGKSRRELLAFASAGHQWAQEELRRAETQRPWQGSVDTWDDWPGRRQRCKSCGDPRADNLKGCEDYPETICDDCAMSLALARIRQAMAMARMREQPPCPWIASLKADEV